MDELPDEAAISVLTLAELHVGMLLAKSPKARAQRLRTLGLVERNFDPIPVDDSIARYSRSWSLMPAGRESILGSWTR